MQSYSVVVKHTLRFPRDQRGTGQVQVGFATTTGISSKSSWAYGYMAPSSPIGKATGSKLMARST